MAAYIYLRVSTKEQKKSRAGLALQLKRCLRVTAQLFETTIVTFEDAGYSGITEIYDRPSLSLLLNTIKKGDFFITADRSRIGRDIDIMVGFETIQSSIGFTLLTADSPVLKIGARSIKKRRSYDVRAERTRVRISENTKKALQEKIDNGFVAGTIPYGFKRHGNSNKLVKCSKEQEVIAFVLNMHSQKHSLRTIVNMLRESDLRSRSNKFFGVTQVNNMIKKRVPTNKSEEVEVTFKPALAMKRTTKIRYGYQAKGVINEQEYQVIELVHKLHSEGFSLRSIAYELNRRNHRNRVGGLFVKTQIVRMLES